MFFFREWVIHAIPLFPHPCFSASSTLHTLTYLIFFLPPDLEAVRLGAILPGAGGGHQRKRTKGHEEVCLPVVRLHLHLQLCPGFGEFFLTVNLFHLSQLAVKMVFFFYFFFLSCWLFSAGFSGHFCGVCWRELRQRVDRRESFHFHLSFQHPPISPGNAADANCCHCASKKTTARLSWMHVKPRA